MHAIENIETLGKRFLQHNYVVDQELATIVFLMQKLQRPLLI